tara:strand:+ start:906 stop:2468 length:1563 start_codon:yes stop_codon:yes gene_type:complete
MPLIKYRLILLFALCSQSLDSLSQTDSTFPRINVVVEGLSGDTIYLANYYGTKLFYNDTTVANEHGEFSFAGKPFEECGKYAIVLPGPIFFDIMLVNEPMTFHTTLSNPSGDMEVVESDENRVFYDYLKFLTIKRSERTPFDVVLTDSSSTPLKVEQAKVGMRILSAEVLEYQDSILDFEIDYLFCKYLEMLKEVEVPMPPSEIEDVDLWRYHWYRNHYWDNVDLTDPRLVRDGALNTLIQRYWGQVLPPAPDTMFVEAVKLLDKVEGNQEIFKFFLHHMTFESESSKVMCMDKVFVRLVEKYYSTEKVDWLNDEQLKKIIDRAGELRYSLCGEIAHNITLPGVDQSSWKSLHDIEAKYTLLVIWESTCGHCKKEMPILQRIYEEWNEKGLEVYAIGNDFEIEPWIDELGKADYSSWTHVSDNPLINAQDSASKLVYSGITDLQSLNFRTTFDVFSTPKLFLLDKDKRILAKQIGALQLAEMLYRIEGLEPPSPELFLSEEAIKRLEKKTETQESKSNTQ